MKTHLVEDHFTVKTLQVYKEKRGAIDIETSITEDPFVELPVLVSVAITFDGKTAFVFKNDEYLEAIRPVLEYTDWIMHNGLFDRLLMRRFGFDLPLVHDTMAMQYLLDPDKPKGLQILSQEYLGLEEYKDVDYDNILDEPWDKVATMNAEDARRTFNLYRPLADQLNRDKKLSRVYQWLLMPTVNALIEVTERGIPIDKEKLNEVTEKYSVLVEEGLQNIQAMAPAKLTGWPKPSWWRVRTHGKYEGDYFNPGSYKQVGEVLYDYYALPVIKWTDTGNKSTDKDVLAQLEARDETPEPCREFLKHLRQYRRDYKVLNSYLVSWPKFITADRMHPRFKPLHVVTGRLSSEKPNIQQVPRTTEFRSLFVAPAGFTWIKADYSQIELRIAAWLANETKLLEAFDNNEDVHALTASAIFGDPSFRQGGKTLNFGLLYGAGPATLQRVARTDYDVWFTRAEAQKYIRNFFALYGNLKRWQELTESSIISSGISRSPLGRIRYLPHAKIPWEVEDMVTKKLAHIREGINHQVQSFAGDLTNMAVARLNETCHVVCAVHDEVNILARNKDVPSVVEHVKDTMEDVSWLNRFGVKLTVPIEVDVETGESWGTAH